MAKLDLSKVLEETERNLSGDCQRTIQFFEKLATVDVSMAQNFELVAHLPGETNRVLDLVLIAFGSWFLCPEAGTLVRLELLDKRNLDLRVKLACASLASCLEVLSQMRSTRTDNAWYGNAEKRLKRLMRNVKIIRRFPRKAKRKVRRRGHRETTNREVCSRRIDLKDDQTNEFFRNLQIAKEERDDIEADYYELLLGFTT
jgi:hypothetical protein